MAIGYNGNSNVPNAGHQHSYTQHELEEYIKCKEDPVYFAEAYFKIIHVDHGLIPIKLYDFQKEALTAYMTNRKMVINASRQVGKTSVATAIILHFVLFNTAKSVAVLSNKGEAAGEILERIKLAYEYLPRFLQCGVVEWNKRTVLFENKSKIIAASSSSDSIRGRAVSMLYIDEMSFIPRWEEFSASVLPTLSSGKETRTIFTSTPHGLNHFYYYVKAAKAGENGFWHQEVPWHVIPGRDEAWKKEVLATINNDLEKFEVEYNCRFSGSSGTLVTGQCLLSLSAVNPIAEQENFVQYEVPQKETLYYVVCDVARGKGLDYSAIQVIKVLPESKFEQVAIYNSNTITPTDFTGVVYNVATLYNNAPTLIEINDIGGQIADMLYNDYEYENVIATESNGRNGKRIALTGRSNDLGIRTTVTVKATGCAVLKLLIEQERLMIKDASTIAQLSVFSKDRNTYKAEAGHNDDLVMPLVLFAWMTTDKYFIESTESNVLLDLARRTEEQVFNDLTPFGFIVNHGEEEAVKEFMGGDMWKLVS